MDFKGLSFSIYGDVCAMEKPNRAAHSLAVAALAEFLCSRCGIEPAKGFAAGLAHDLCKNLSKPAQWQLARKLPKGFEHLIEYESAMEGASSFGDHIVHGPASAAFCMEKYGIRDYEFLEALAIHSTGKTDMGDLSKIVYIADKLEPGRITPDGTRDALVGMNLSSLMLFAVKAVVEWFGGRKLAVADATVALYEELSREAAGSR